MTATPFCPFLRKRSSTHLQGVTDLCLTIKCRKQIKRATVSLHCVTVRTTSVNKSCMSVRISVSHSRANEKERQHGFYVLFLLLKKERHNAIPMISNKGRRPSSTATLHAMVVLSAVDSNRNEESFLGIC